MRIQQITIDRWRHFEGIKIELPDAAPIICIVGGNGTGKSQVLELIAVCAHRIGLSAGNELPRGDPFSEGADFSVRFFLSQDTLPLVEDLHSYEEDLRPFHSQWDRTITVGTCQNGEFIFAGGVDWQHSKYFAAVVIDFIRKSESVHYLSLDADRAYPKIKIASHQLGEIYDKDWGDQTTKQSSYKISRNLYEEWFRFLIGRENQKNNKHIQEIRRSRESGSTEPVFVDEFDPYKKALQTVLPHLLFVGVDPQTRQIQYDSTGLELTFDQLSGGEREIAFLVGQIERFGLKKGLLLVDEPELHLNYDLLRAWIGYLKASVEEGQIWLATHALEVVEVTGQDATIVLERDELTRKVLSATSMSNQPVVVTLSRAMGSPAFSIANLSFVIVEGEEEIGERERFRLLCDVPPRVRFMEGGSCKEVLKRIETLKSLASTSGQSIRIGGVVDSDWRTSSEKSNLVSKGVFVLGVHEVENFFLHPETLRSVVTSIGGDASVIIDEILASSDRRAGSWIFDAARTDSKFREYPEPSKKVRELVHGLSWADFHDLEQRCSQIAGLHGALDASQQAALNTRLVAHAKIYGRKRLSDDLWRVCEGKEVFKSIIRTLGFADDDAAERAITAYWKRVPASVPTELIDLRTYIASI